MPLGEVRSGSKIKRTLGLLPDSVEDFPGFLGMVLQSINRTEIIYDQHS